MAKVTFEFKRDFAQRVEKGVMEGITADVHVEFQGDEKTPAGALVLIMADLRQNIINQVMAQLIERMREMGDHAEGGIYTRNTAKH